MKLIVIGSSNIDLIVNLPKIPIIGETVLGGESAMVFGGKGANQAIAAKRTGNNIGFIAKVGNDFFGKKMLHHFEAEGLPTHLILTDKTTPTGVAQIFVSAKGENSIGVAPGANMTLMCKDLKPFLKTILKAKVWLLQLEIPIKTIEYLVSTAFENNIKLILNPAPACNLSSVLLKKIWLITPNETEAEILTGVLVTDSASAQRAASILLNKGVRNVIVTMGEKGCQYATRKISRFFPSFRVLAVDSTAAGDVFNGTLAMAIANGETIQDTIEIASAAAAISVTKQGAQTSIPTYSEIDAFLKKNNSTKY